MASIRRRTNKKGEVISISIRVYRGRDEYGKEIPPYAKSVKIPKGTTERQLKKIEQAEAAAFEKECSSGLSIDGNILFRDFAREVMAIKRTGGKEHSTLSRYTDMLKLRLIPCFGHLKVKSITGVQLNKFYAALLQEGQNKRTGGPLSAKTVLEYHRLLSVIFAEAKKQHVIFINPAEDATPPKVTKKLPNYFQHDELAKIKEAFDNAPIKWRTLGYLCMIYGDRRSEFAGIKRTNINFEKGYIVLSGGVLYKSDKGVYEKNSLKNEKDRHLPMTPEVKALLKEYLIWLDSEKEKFGDMWRETEYLFTGEHGGPMNPDNITQYFRRMSKRYQAKDPTFPHINPHAFRHTVVSMLLNKGVDAVSVADYVGDDAATITKHYAHLINEGKVKAANTMSSILSESIANNF